MCVHCFLLSFCLCFCLSLSLSLSQSLSLCLYLYFSLCLSISLHLSLSKKAILCMQFAGLKICKMVFRVVAIVCDRWTDLDWSGRVCFLHFLQNHKERATFQITWEVLNKYYSFLKLWVVKNDKNHPC